MKPDRPILVIDFETSGIDPFRDHPIAFGAILLDPNNSVSIREIELLIRPPESCAPNLWTV